MSWTPTDSEQTYQVDAWGDPFFGINATGRVQVTPDGNGGAAIDLADLVDQIRRRGVPSPILLRFDGILRTRVRQLNEAFAVARKDAQYPAAYRGVYPIKVNQERQVVEALLAEGKVHGLGLEVGSKPELIAAIAIQAGEGTLMICNGYKDREYIEMALLASHLGITAVLVVEKRTELDTILEAAERLGIEPVIGVRAKLSIRGSGRWKDSVGERSKFGLTTRQIVDVVETLRARDKLDCLKLTHFHIGSQITHIRALKQAMREATNLLAGLSQMGVKVQWFDVGGGLGIDYDGSSTDFESSRNYSLQEYANDVVWALAECCETNGVEAPVIVSESGRGLAAHHAVLVSDVVGVSSLDPKHEPSPIPDDAPSVLIDLAPQATGMTEANYMERYHDALEARETASLLFDTGQLSLPHRALIEEYVWRVRRAVLDVTRTLEYVPDDFEDLENELADTYFVNFSIFQSMPDSWAIGQLFPILPIQRLNEEPTERGILADLTCDSDGKISKFIDRRDVKSVLELHKFTPGERYDLGFFLVGAYQEILGDMHNLFGDANVVHVDLDANGRPKLSHVLRGDRVKEVLGYVEYFEADLLRSLRGHVEDALEKGRMTYEESADFWARYESGLRGSTYLTPESQIAPIPSDESESTENRTA
jgi:arginine decarboxylase